MQDIETLAKDLPRLHANLFFRTSRETFDREVDSLKTRVAEMTDYEVVTGLIRLAALPGDAHTAISPFSYPGFRRLPIRMRFLSDGLVVTSAAPGGEALLGGRIVTIGDLDIATAIERIGPVVSRDNDAWLRAIGPNYLVIPEILRAQRIVADAERVRMSVVLPDGTAAQAELPALAAGREGTFADASSAPLPLYRQRGQENYWYTWTDPDVLYLQYNRCQNAANDPMSSFAKRVLDDIDRRSPRAVIVDLRANGGGDSSVLDPLLSGLRARSFLAQSGRLFAFIGNSTFSSALMNAISLKRENGAILVGEPTGGKPNGYGEVRSFTLPNSALSVSYSTKFFNSWPGGDPDSLLPDIAAAPSSVDYRDGRDPAMDAVAARLGLPRLQPTR
ncbi:MAG: hypothetical protein K1Y01_20625 [Vicinamibacteria bacterium]|nr:hypothetical protein [Vicinamibacteria bacterium]